jgi:NADH-quinone oxidoreductase subunit M
MELLLLIFLPLSGAIFTSFFGRSPIAKTIALLWSLLSLAHTLSMLNRFVPDSTVQFYVDYPWIERLGIHFTAGIDGITMLMVLLTNLLMPLIILSSFKQDYDKPGAFYGLILFMQSGLLVVFTALDAFLFYVGWEAALIPIYFICALWGGGDRIRVNLKFFIYTIAGSLIMLVAIIYLYLQTPDKQYGVEAFYNLNLDKGTQGWIFWAFFLAFAIKMPVFPFHTWQPDTYTEAPTTGTMLLSGIMLKMGAYGAIRWLIPVVPLGFERWGETALILSVIGIVYASVIAFTQKDAKRLVAYSSIAHVGLISAGIFAWNMQGLQGALIQMLSHGINVIGLFLVLDIIARQLNTRDLSQMGGIATKAPKLAICFLIILLGSVALPLTNGFVGEFLLLLGVFKNSLLISAVAGLTIIFGAVYMFRMYQKAMLGTNERTLNFVDVKGTELTVLVIICALIIFIGVSPSTILDISNASVAKLAHTVLNKLILR